jgi:hypothetical protein
MLTYFDAVEHLVTASFGGPQDAEQRDIRSAVLRAYDEVTTIRDWMYYSVHGRIITNVPYTTGTVAYSSSAPSLTLTGGTWPSWAAGAHVKIGPRVVAIVSVAGQVATLDASVKLPDSMDGQSGLTYTVYRVNYPLPADFRNMDEPTNEYNWWSGVYLTPDEAMKLERVSNSSGKPLHWTVIKDPNGTGWIVKLVGYPTAEETVDFTYRRTARQLKYSGHEAKSRVGTITRSSATVTGSSTQFSSDMVGCILRVGDTSAQPGPQWSLNPAAEETTVLAVGGSTSLTTAASGTVAAGTKYIVTDPIDVPPHMHNVLLSGAEYWLSRTRNKSADKEFALYQRDLRLALERDQLTPLSGRSRQIYHDGGWRSPLKPDGGV